MSSHLESVVTHEALYASWRAAYRTHINGGKVQKECNSFWMANKRNQQLLQQKLLELKAVACSRKKQKPLVHFLVNHSKKPKNAAAVNSSQIVTAETLHETTISDGQCASKLSKEAEKEHAVTLQSERAPSQATIRKHLQSLQEDIDFYNKAKSKGLASDQDIEQLKKLEKQKIDAGKKLRELQRCQAANKKSREKKFRKLQILKETHPQLKVALSALDPLPVGRPSLETKYQNLSEMIIKIVSSSSHADLRRRSAKLNTCKTLLELQQELAINGIELSANALYHRLLPKNSKTNEGKRHVRTVPVRLVKAQNNAKKEHQDAHFAAATIKNLRQLAETMGKESSLIISQDDKSRIPLGLAAANKQSHILMHLDYIVSLPDHDFGVAPRHRLIPSVYAVLCQDEKHQVTYSGPTAIFIRSAKHDSSTAYTHHEDFNQLLQHPDLKPHVETENGLIKPIVIILTDGGPDENPRFKKTIDAAADKFLRLNLDALFVATYAPGNSAYNPVERWMAPLSRDLAGIILKHDILGSHLNSSGKTIDIQLEKKNFAAAGEILANVWSENLIDGYKTVAQYVEPVTKTPDLKAVSEAWLSKHVRSSQYFLQLVKCTDTECCSPFRSTYCELFPDRFVPGPMPLKISKSGLTLSEDTGEMDNMQSGLWKRLGVRHLEAKVSAYRHFPYDFFLPSMKGKVGERVCKTCGLYFPTKSALSKHSASHKGTDMGLVKSLEYIVDMQEAETEAASLEFADESSDTEACIHNEPPEDPTAEQIETESGIEVIADWQDWNAAVFEEDISFTYTALP